MTLSIQSLLATCFTAIAIVSNGLATPVAFTSTASNSSSVDIPIFTRHEILKEGIYNVNWTVDISQGTVEFFIEVKTLGFVGFGLSYTGGMTGADVIIGGVIPDGTTYFTDRHAVGNFEPVVDASQDWELVKAWETDEHTHLQVIRKLVTCDDNDILINDDTLKLIWSYGETDSVSYHGVNRGSVVANLLDHEVEVPDLSQYEKWTISKEVILPPEDTLYLCTFFEGPKVTKKNHIVGFDMYFDSPESRQHTHHSDFYRCTPPPGEDPQEFFSKHLDITYDCYNDKRPFPVEHCTLFEFQWSIGGKLTVFPDDIGAPIGEKEVEFYMTEIHYDNPNKIDQLRLHTGMTFYLTPNLRPLEAGFLFVGGFSSRLYSLTVPPNSENFVFSSHCSSECTKFLNSDGIDVFIYLLHSHLSGRKQKIRHFRNGEEIEYLANDEHYDFNYQNNRLLRETVKILPGDSLTLECTYDTTWKKGLATTGGRSPREEMCQTFLMYYPKTLEVNQCGSNFPQQTMLDFMGIEEVSKEQGVIDPTVLSPAHLAGMKYSQVVEAIDWTPEKRQVFQNLTRYSLHEAYCSPFDEVSGEPFGSVTYPTYNAPYEPPNPCKA